MPDAPRLARAASLDRARVPRDPRLPLRGVRLVGAGAGEGDALRRQDTRRPSMQRLQRVPAVVRPTVRAPVAEARDFPISPLTPQQIRFILGCDEDERLQKENGCVGDRSSFKRVVTGKESTVRELELTSGMIFR